MNDDLREVAGTVSAKWAKGSGGPAGDECYNLVPVNCDKEIRTVRRLTVTEQNGGIIKNADAIETNSGTILRILREKIGEEAFAVWGFGVLVSLQSTEVLRQALHGAGIRYAAFGSSWLVNCTLPCKEKCSSWLLQSLRRTECKGCPPQGWQPSEQFSRELRTYLSALSQPGTQEERLMHDLWQASGGSGLLRETLSTVQKIRGPFHDKSQPIHPRYAVRRLVPTETEFLQGFPRNWTAIPYRGKPVSECPDGPRYKVLGNSMAVPCMRWIGERIAAVERRHKQEVHDGTGTDS